MTLHDLWLVHCNPLASSGPLYTWTSNRDFDWECIMSKLEFGYIIRMTINYEILFSDRLHNSFKMCIGWQAWPVSLEGLGPHVFHQTPGICLIYDWILIPSSVGWELCLVHSFFLQPLNYQQHLHASLLIIIRDYFIYLHNFMKTNTPWTRRPRCFIYFQNINWPCYTFLRDPRSGNLFSIYKW